MKRVALFVSLLFCWCLPLNAQNDYYERQAKCYQNDAVSYLKHAQGYDRETEYYR